MTEVLDVYNDPYGRGHYARKKRVAFEKIKQTPEFKEWRGNQMRLQKGRCAYCKIRLRINNIVTHVDHVQPLYFEGSNNFANLVLSCRRCNLRKGVSNTHVVPEWIKDRAVAIEGKNRLKGLKEIRRAQRKQMEELVAQELDEQMLDTLDNL